MTTTKSIKRIKSNVKQNRKPHMVHHTMNASMRIKTKKARNVKR